MNFSTFIGFLLSGTVFTLALVTSSKDYMIFLDQHAILIVIGGTVSASCVCFSLPKVMGLIKVFFKRMLGRNKRDYLALIDEIATLSAASRKGPQEFEKAIPRIRDPFLRDAAQIIIWKDSDVPHEDLRSLLEVRAETHFERYMAEADIFKVMARFPPAFGLLGTTLGMIALLQSLGTPEGKTKMGAAMSIALVATLYGIVMANFIFTPIAENLTQQSKEDLIARRIVVEGIMLIAADKPTQFVEEKCKSFLLPSERGGNRRRPAGQQQAA